MLILSTLILTVFLISQHPLFMSLLLMTLSVTYALFMVKFLTMPWLSYMLVMVFVSGFMVIVLYMTGISSNEKMNMGSFELVLFITPIMFLGMSSQQKGPEQEVVNMGADMVMNIIYKTYDHMLYPMTLMVIIYLLIVLIVAVKLVMTDKMPLKMNK